MLLYSYLDHWFNIRNSFQHVFLSHFLLMYVMTFLNVSRILLRKSKKSQQQIHKKAYSQGFTGTKTMFPDTASRKNIREHVYSIDENADECTPHASDLYPMHASQCVLVTQWPRLKPGEARFSLPANQIQAFKSLWGAALCIGLPQSHMAKFYTISNKAKPTNCSWRRMCCMAW